LGGGKGEKEKKVSRHASILVCHGRKRRGERGKALKRGREARRGGGGKEKGDSNSLSLQAGGRKEGRRSPRGREEGEGEGGSRRSFLFLEEGKKGGEAPVSCQKKLTPEKGGKKRSRRNLYISLLAAEGGEERRKALRPDRKRKKKKKKSTDFSLSVKEGKKERPSARKRSLTSSGSGGGEGGKIPPKKGKGKSSRGGVEGGREGNTTTFLPCPQRGGEGCAIRLASERKEKISLQSPGEREKRHRIANVKEEAEGEKKKKEFHQSFSLLKEDMTTHGKAGGGGESGHVLLAAEEKGERNSAFSSVWKKRESLRHSPTGQKKRRVETGGQGRKGNVCSPYLVAKGKKNVARGRTEGREKKEKKSCCPTSITLERKKGSLITTMREREKDGSYFCAVGERKDPRRKKRIQPPQNKGRGEKEKAFHCSETRPYERN